MDTQGQSIRQWRMSKGMSQKDLADALQVSPPYLSEVESGKKKVSRVLRVRLMDLGWRHEVIRVNVAKTDEPVVVPLYRTVIRAGDGSVAVEDTTEGFDVSAHYSNTCVYEVSGDSMILAGIEEGDRIVVRLGYRFKNKDVILCRYNGQLTVKGVVIDRSNTIWLVPANKRMHPWPCKDGDEFQCIGRVVEVIREPRTEWWDDVELPNDSLEGPTYRNIPI